MARGWGGVGGIWDCGGGGEGEGRGPGLLTGNLVLVDLLMQFQTAKQSSRKRTYIILTPLRPYFYIIKLGFTGVYSNFLISAQKHRLLVLVRNTSSKRF